MKKSVKIALATGALGVVAATALVGSSYADRGGFGGGFGPGFGMRGGPGGPGGPIVHEMLANVDANGDGALSQDEINTAIDARFAEFDANADGSLSLEEFQALWAEITSPMTVRAFQFLDPNGDAQIAKSELDDRFGSLVAQFDHNDDGLLDPDDRPGRGGPGNGPRWMHGDRDGSGPRWQNNQ